MKEKVTSFALDFFTKRIAGNYVVSGAITALEAASPQRKVKNVGRRTSGPCGARRVRKDVRGP